MPKIIVSPEHRNKLLSKHHKQIFEIGKFTSEKFLSQIHVEDILAVTNSFDAFDSTIDEPKAMQSIGTFDERMVKKEIPMSLFEQLKSKMKNPNIKYGLSIDQNIYELGFRFYVGCSVNPVNNDNYNIIIVPTMCNKTNRKEGKEKSAFHETNPFFAIDVKNKKPSSDTRIHKDIQFTDPSNVQAVVFTLGEYDDFINGFNPDIDLSDVNIHLFFARETSTRKLNLILRFVKPFPGTPGMIIPTTSGGGGLYFDKGDLIPPPPDDESNRIVDTSFLP